MQSIETYRSFFANLMVRSAGSSDERLIAAFSSVERERYLGPGPWQICDGAGSYLTSPGDDPRLLYQNLMVGLIPELGINNGEPLLHARCLSACALVEGDSVIHIGAGTGYYTALLATVVGPQGRVLGYEIHPELSQRARENLAHITWAEVRAVSATEGVLPASDVIYVSAGVTHPVPAWLESLKLGGRLLLPLTTNEGLGCMLLAVRVGDRSYAASLISFAKFIPCVGARDDTEAEALAHALQTRSTTEVRSLRIGRDHDQTAWCICRDWWLSTAAADTTPGADAANKPF